MKTMKICLLAMALLPLCAKAADTRIWIEAESFQNKGGWVVDQQSMDQMGSPYLLAHGLGKPVADATTTVDVPESGEWHVYVRTYNWTSPWTEENGPGKFRLGVGKKILKADLGITGNSWEWQYAGAVTLKAGQTEVSLHDMTGFDGRCDAVYMTTGKDDVPPCGDEELAAFRKREMNLPPPEELTYDLVVVGGGIGGICTAVSAARLGCKVALVQDRPVLGGNNSSEIRVGLGGYTEIPPYEGLGRMIREFGHKIHGNANPAEYYEDGKKQDFVEGEENIELFSSFHAVDVNMDGNSIKSVLIRHIETSEEVLLSAPLFSDCTGDGSLGYLAGADYRMGRESREEFGESLAPEVPDSLTLGSSVLWYSEEKGKKTAFPEFHYGIEFTEESCQPVTKSMFLWETGMNRDKITEAERIRDYALLVIYSNWSFLKNHKADNGEWRNLDLAWVAYVLGKRESRRLMGDYILKQDDLDKYVFHEDASFTTSYSIELHYPDPKNSEYFPGEEFRTVAQYDRIYPYPVPYRCLYSRNISNLFMAGRCISVTHVAHGTTRIMRTIGMMGEVVGMAASLCKKYGCVPREVYWYHLDELKPLMKEGVGKYVGDVSEQRFNLDHQLDRPRIVVQE